MMGCGGSSDPSQQNDDKIKINGIASDDLIVNGVVKAYGANDVSKTVLDEGRTSNTDGSYTLDVVYDGVVVVEVICDSASKMLTPTGNRIDCAPDLKLHSAAAVKPTSGAVKVNVSPLTEAVVKRMETLGTSSVAPEHLVEASEDIEEMFGVDPIADSPLEGDYSNIIASFHALDENLTDKSITDIINDIADDLKDGKAGDSEIISDLAKKMKEKNLINNIADNNGTFDPEVNTLDFSSDELIGHTFYVVENVDYGQLDFNATHTKWTSMFNTDEYDIGSYVIENGKLKFADGSMIERFVKTDSYSVVRPTGKDINIFIFDSEDAAEAKISQLSANFFQEVQDSQTDNKKSHKGFELTSLKTTIVDNKLVIEVKTKGDIQNALDTVANTPNYANILWIEINDYYEFGLMANGDHYMQKLIRTDGEFVGENEGVVAGYTYRLLSGNKGVELSVPLSSLDRIDNILTSTLMVRAEVGEDDMTVNAEGEENDENIYDTIESFVQLKTIPITSTMFANKIFYNSWIDNGQIVYGKIQTTATDINATEQKGNLITNNNGTYTISNGKVSAVMDDGNSELSVLSVKSDHVIVLYQGQSEQEIGIEPWYFSKPSGFPSFIQGEGNHAPTISIAYPPITLEGIPLDMKMIGFNDLDQDDLTMGVMSLPSNGKLQINGSDAVVGQTISLNQIQSVMYLSNNDFNGTVTSEINVTDGIDTAIRDINITVLNKNSTLSITTNMLNNKTFYNKNINENDESIEYFKLDFNTTHVIIDKVTVLSNISGEDTENLEYNINNKILQFGDSKLYLLKNIDRLWKFGAEYNDEDKSIEVWYTNKPDDFPDFGY
jgi:hypothetical protein